MQNANDAAAATPRISAANGGGRVELSRIPQYPAQKLLVMGIDDDFQGWLRFPQRLDNGLQALDSGPQRKKVWH